MTSCKLCGQTIRWDKHFVSETTGKMIPLEEFRDRGNEPHQCQEWKAQHRRYYDCRNCSKPIYFDDNQKSKNGKYIPLDKETGQPHDCEKRDQQ